MALAVLAVALAAAIRVAGENADATGYLRDKAIAQWVAANELAERQLRGDWPKPDRYPGKTEMGGRTWYWRLTVTDTPDPALRRLELDVFPDAKRVDAIHRLTGFVGRP